MDASMRRYDGSGGKPVRITYPKTPSIKAAENKSLKLFFFVAAGLADPQIEFVVGRMIDKATNNTFQGRTFYNPPKWGIHFLVPTGKYTLEVIGISFDPVTGLPTDYSVRQDLEIGGLKFFDLVISCPNNDDTCCLSSFAAWGTYGPNNPGSICVKLSSVKANTSVTLTALTDGAGDWSALFTTLTQASDDYELEVWDTAGDSPPAPVTGLNLSNDSC